MEGRGSGVNPTLQEQKAEQGVVAKRNQWDREREGRESKGQGVSKKSCSDGATERVKVMDAYRPGSKLKCV